MSGRHNCGWNLVLWLTSHPLPGLVQSPHVSHRFWGGHEGRAWKTVHNPGFWCWCLKIWSSWESSVQQSVRYSTVPNNMQQSWVWVSLLEGITSQPCCWWWRWSSCRGRHRRRGCCCCCRRCCCCCGCGRGRGHCGGCCSPANEPGDTVPRLSPKHIDLHGRTTSASTSWLRVAYCFYPLSQTVRLQIPLFLTPHTSWTNSQSSCIDMHLWLVWRPPQRTPFGCPRGYLLMRVWCWSSSLRTQPNDATRYLEITGHSQKTNTVGNIITNIYVFRTSICSHIINLMGADLGPPEEKCNIALTITMRMLKRLLKCSMKCTSPTTFEQVLLLLLFLASWPNHCWHT